MDAAWSDAQEAFLKDKGQPDSLSRGHRDNLVAYYQGELRLTRYIVDVRGNIIDITAFRLY
jgi:hypothetical protein